MYNNILKDVMLPYAEWNMSLKWIFQQGNDTKHTAKVIKQWGKDNHIMPSKPDIVYQSMKKVLKYANKIGIG